MEKFYVFIVIVLFILAISDLIVGVSNDAVNFLNSAIGSKVAKFKVIIIIAGLGILVGATFSNGMMEVARKSIFNPQMFYFQEIMFIFLAVMITDVILLDLFNTFGLPTSTTVSIVFELLGAAVAMALIKISHNNGLGSVADYINTSTAMKIIFGILLSVIVSFTVGMVIQALSRTLFAFNYEKSYKYFGALFGGLAISAITYFMLIKGAKGTSFLDTDKIEWIKENTGKILIYSFIGWSIFLQLLIWLFKTNILKIIVLVGTFSLAMAFAGNDLVNFIGVPLAGFESFKQFSAASGADATGFLMEGLTKKIATPTEYLLIAGLIMVATMWLSKKAKSVTQTSLDLSRQEEGDERFGSSLIARVLVREGIRLGNVVGSVVPKSLAKAISKRFDQSKIKSKKNKDKVSFDLVRASVNLIVAAVLIAIGTSHKLPLSTTYVTFMVAMGTSLSDGAWNRESAVYRITGVFTVIGGWFFTAFAAFTTAFVMAYIIHWGEIFSVIGLMIVALLLVIRTHMVHKKSYDAAEKESKEDTAEISDISVISKCKEEISKFFKYSSENVYNIINALVKDKRKPLVKTKPDMKEREKYFNKIKKKAHRNLIFLNEQDLEQGYAYLNIIDQLEKAFIDQKKIYKLIFEHIDNNLKPIDAKQKNELAYFNEQLLEFKNNLYNLLSSPDKKTDSVSKQKDALKESVQKLQKHNIKLIKKKEIGTQTSLMYQGVMTEIKQYINDIYDLLIMYRNL